MKKFRVLFNLSDNNAEIFNSVENKSEYVSMALEWYIALGSGLEESFSKLEGVILKRIEHLEASILKELGFQGTESLRDRDAIREELAKLLQFLTAR